MATAWVAVGLSLLAILLTWLERQDRKRSVKAEQADRREGLDLLRREIEATEASHRVQATANVTAQQGPRSGGERRDGYQFRVLNGGPAIARRVRIWAVNELDERLTEIIDVAPVLAVTHEAPAILEIDRVLSRAGNLRLVLAWEDSAGPHKETGEPIEPVSRAP
jgi:heme exporter protein D